METAGCSVFCCSGCCCLFGLARRKRRAENAACPAAGRRGIKKEQLPSAGPLIFWSRKRKELLLWQKAQHIQMEVRVL